MAMRKLALKVGAAAASIALLATGFAPAATAQSSGSSGNDVGRALTSSLGASDSHAPEGGAKVVVFGDSHTSGTTMPWRTDERNCERVKFFVCGASGFKS